MNTTHRLFALPLLLLLGLPAAHADITHVRVLPGADPSREAVVCWRVDAAAAQLELQSPDAAPRTLSAQRGPDGFRVDLTALAPGVRHAYRLSVEGEPNPVSGSFETAPAGPADFSFAVVGDVQGKGPSTAWREAAQWLAARKPAFWIPVGDLVNLGQDTAQWDAFFADGAELFRVAPVWPVVGNHDLYRDGQAEGKRFISAYPGLFYSFFPLPAPIAGEAFDGWYTLPYGSLRVVALNSYAFPAPGDPLAADPPAYEAASRARQLAWAREVLAASPAALTLMVLHPPVYCSGPHGVSGDRPYERAVADLADAFRVDAVFSGHTHVFEVTHPLRGGRVAEAGAAGTVYYSTAGINFSDAPAGAWYTAARQEQPREPLVALVQVRGGRMTIETWNWRTDTLVHRAELQSAEALRAAAPAPAGAPPP